MPVYRDKARNRWRYEFSRIVGGRRRRATKLLPAPWNRTQAEAYARDQDAKLYALATGAARQQPLISEAVRLYLEQHAPRLKNADKLARDLALLMPFYKGRGLDELPQICRDYAAKAGVSLATVKVRLAYLRAACRWAWKTHNLGDHDPAERVTLPSVSNERQRYVPRKTVLQIARAMNHRQARAVALVSFYSGMRLSECLRAVPADGCWALADTKNGEPRLVPIHKKVAYLARRWPPAVPARTVQSWFHWAAGWLGIDDLKFHDLRHSAASAMINAGVPLYTVGTVLGHKAQASTKRYSHLATSTLADAIGKIA
jgi:integrase